MSVPGQRGGRKSRLTGNRCECTACGEMFNGVSGFDRHRVGRHGVGRRCLNVSEMTARGYSRNEAGFWVTDSEAQRAGRHAGAGHFAARDKAPAVIRQCDRREGI